MRRDMDSGEERELYRTMSQSTDLGVLLLSPDGRQVAFNVVNPEGMRLLLTVPAPGGNPRELYRSKLDLGVRAWSKDGRHLLVTQPDSKSGKKQL